MKFEKSLSDISLKNKRVNIMINNNSTIDDLDFEKLPQNLEAFVNSLKEKYANANKF